MPTERRPNFFIVGAQKAGTGATSDWLSRHPQVFMSFPKEPGYLAFGAGGYVFPDGYGRRAPASEYVVRDEQTYLGLFARATEEQKILGEASTWYFSLPGMAERLKHYSPQARILVILRNPVERAYSAWSHARRDDLEPCARFRDALAMEAERGEVEFLLRYRRMGLYSDALAEYRAIFEPSRLLVLFYEELQKDRERLWRRLCDFLEIDRLSKPPGQRRLNRSGIPRSRLLQKVLGSHKTRRMARKTLPHAFATWTKEKLDELNLRAFSGPDAGTRDMLRAYYRADIERLAQMTGRDLDSWLE